MIDILFRALKDLLFPEPFTPEKPWTLGGNEAWQCKVCDSDSAVSALDDGNFYCEDHWPKGAKSRF